jgi:hypothetical protein
MFYIELNPLGYQCYVPHVEIIGLGFFYGRVRMFVCQKKMELYQKCFG